MGMPNTLNDRFATRDVGGASFSMDAEAANEITLAVQLLDREGRHMQKRSYIRGYLSADANGDADVSVGAGIIVSQGTNGRVVRCGITAQVGHHSFAIVTEANGKIDLSVTDPNVTTNWVVLIMPNGDLIVSPPMAYV